MTKLDTAKCYEKVYTDYKKRKPEHTYVGKFIRQYTEGSGDGMMSYAEFKKQGKTITVEDGSWTGTVEFKEVECKGSEKLITKNNGKDKKKTGNGVNELYPYNENNGKIEPKKEGILSGFFRNRNPFKTTKRAKELMEKKNKQEEEPTLEGYRENLKHLYGGGNRKTRKRKTKKSRKTRK